MISLLLVLGTVTAVFSIIGRVTTPGPERVPLTQWAPRDLYWNFRHGLYVCSNHSTLDRLMDNHSIRTDDH